MNYFLINVKKIYKNKLNSIPVFIIILFLVFLYVGNLKSATIEFDLDSPISIKEDINSTSKQIKLFEKNLKSISLDSEEYINIKNDLNLAKERKEYLENKLKAYKNKDWHQFYQNDIRLKKIDLEANKYESDYDDEFLQTIKLNEEYFLYQYENKLGFDDRFTPVQGISYIILIVNNYLSIILIVMMAFILSSLYCSNYFNGIDISIIVPMKQVNRIMTKLMVGCFVGISATLLVLIISGTLGSIGTEFGSLKSPILTYCASGICEYEPIINFMMSWIIMSILSMLFISNVIFVLSGLLKKKTSCFFSSLLFLFACTWGCTKIAPIFSIVHLIPTTYLNCLQVLSGEIGYLTQNNNINALTGIIVLLVCNIVLTIINFSLMKMREVK
ncbi:hypothetical protein [Holdemanella biformis]|uniref:Uncharacterized protein n=1 Tax=Holdemanella biformis TaxID=1735 RepID=A0A395WAJ3_9FIRM|nr:hypothetical protein [Holdemanella biformis]RGU71572.1 hypothetical protein DWW49_06620 [Holdemanella biformis]RGU91046.1 hypothetical protein DWW32_07635 [Holdemanella biformis]